MGGSWWAPVGGIVGLSQLAVEHRAELCADFRSIYHTEFDAVPASEVWGLMKLLLADPTSRFHAAVAGWSHPLDYEGMFLLDLLDLLLMRWSEKGQFKPLPRPWDAKRVTKKRSPSEALRILRPHLVQGYPSEDQENGGTDDSSGDRQPEPVTG